MRAFLFEGDILQRWQELSTAHVQWFVTWTIVCLYIHSDCRVKFLSNLSVVYLYMICFFE